MPKQQSATATDPVVDILELVMEYGRCACAYGASESREHTAKAADVLAQITRALTESLGPATS